MKRLPLVAGVLGLALVVVLIANSDYREILRVLDRAGWALLWLIPFHAMPLLLDAEGWRVLLRTRDPQQHLTLPFLLWVASVREAVSRLLPAASVGGELVGIRLVLMRPLSGAAVSASVMVEVLLTLVGQYLFSALGLIVLLAATRRADLLDSLMLGLVASAPLLLLFYALLRHGSLFARVERALIAMLGERSRVAALLGNAAALDAEIRALSARHATLASALCWQLAGMIVGAFETWLALRLLGHEVGAGEAFALESLTLAVRHFAFFMPGGLGVQEASYVLLGKLVGLPPEVAVALSLAKRLREIGFGVPALLSWQWIEARRHRPGWGRPGSAVQPAADGDS